MLMIPRDLLTRANFVLPRKDIFERSGLPVQELSFIWQAELHLDRWRVEPAAREALSQNDQRLQQKFLVVNDLIRVCLDRYRILF